MKHLFISFTFLLLLQSSLAQIKTESLDLGKDNEILNTLQIPNNGGLVIKTGKNIKWFDANSVNWKLNYYSPDMELIYSVDIDKNDKNHEYESLLIGSTNSKVVYHLEPYELTISKITRSYSAIQIDEKGNKKTFVLDNVADGYRKSMFADDKFFYCFFGEKSKNEQVHTLIRISASDLSETKTPIKLPELRNKSKSTAWHYSGNFDNAIYFTSKTFIEDGSLIYDIVQTDNAGKILKSFSIDTKFASNSLRATNNIKYYYWAAYTTNDFNVPDVNQSYYDIFPEAWVHFPAAGENAYGDILFNPTNNCIFIYGLCSQGKGDKSPADNYFIQKYDMDGKLIWKNEYAFPKNEASDVWIKKSYLSYYREVGLNVSNKDTVLLQIKTHKYMYTHTIESNTGKFISFYFNNVCTQQNACFSKGYDPSINSPLNKYLASQDLSLYHTYVNVFRFNQSCIVIEDKTKEKIITLMKF